MGACGSSNVQAATIPPPGAAKGSAKVAGTSVQPASRDRHPQRDRVHSDQLSASTVAEKQPMPGSSSSVTAPLRWTQTGSFADSQITSQRANAVIIEPDGSISLGSPEFTRQSRKPLNLQLPDRRRGATDRTTQSPIHDSRSMDSPSMRRQAASAASHRGQISHSGSADFEPSSPSMTSVVTADGAHVNSRNSQTSVLYSRTSQPVQASSRSRVFGFPPATLAATASNTSDNAPAPPAPTSAPVKPAEIRLQTDDSKTGTIILNKEQVLHGLQLHQAAQQAAQQEAEERMEQELRAARAVVGPRSLCVPVSSLPGNDSAHQQPDEDAPTVAVVPQHPLMQTLQNQTAKTEHSSPNGWHSPLLVYRLPLYQWGVTPPSTTTSTATGSPASSASSSERSGERERDRRMREPPADPLPGVMEETVTGSAAGSHNSVIS